MQTMTVQKIDTATITETVLDSFTRFTNRQRAELVPDDPPRTVGYWRKQFVALQELEDWCEHYWLVREGDELIARAWAGVEHRPENRHLMYADLYVLPEHRRQGVAKHLLEQIVRLADAETRTSLIFDTSSRAPAGARFAEVVGAREGIENHTNQLELKNVDPDLLRVWIAEGEAKARDFTVGGWTGLYPEAHIEAVCELIEVMNTEPRGKLEVEDFKVTPKQLRDEEAYFAKTGLERWTFWARHSSGEFAGYTQTGWQPDMPGIISQWGTGVKPNYRGHGLGKWLKAKMLEKILADRPEATLVRTGNADVNAPMLAINQALGFAPYTAHIDWQVDVASLKEYLQTREK